MALSSFDEMAPGTSFKPILPDTLVKPENVQKILLCSGKVFYDLLTERQGKQMEDKIAIIRIEQLCPFPYHLLKQEVAKYPNSKVQKLNPRPLQLPISFFANDLTQRNQLFDGRVWVYYSSTACLDHVVARRAQKSRRLYVREGQDSIGPGTPSRRRSLWW